MARFLSLLVALFLLIQANPTFAKSYGSKSSFSSFKSSKSWSTSTAKPSSGYSKPSTYAAPASSQPKSSSIPSATDKTTKSWGAAPTTTKPSSVTNTSTKTFGTSTVTTPSTNTSVKLTAADREQTKKTILYNKDKTAASKYTSKKQAELAYRQSLISKNKYTSATPPSTRPTYVPSSVTVSGRPTTVIYHSVPGGGYGYGYMDPLTHAFVTLAVADMIMDAHEMRNAGYGNWDANGRAIVAAPPVYQQPVVPQESHVGAIILGVIAVIIIIGILIFIVL